MRWVLHGIFRCFVSVTNNLHNLNSNSPRKFECSAPEFKYTLFRTQTYLGAWVAPHIRLPDVSTATILDLLSPRSAPSLLVCALSKISQKKPQKPSNLFKNTHTHKMSFDLVPLLCPQHCCPWEKYIDTAWYCIPLTSKFLYFYKNPVGRALGAKAVKGTGLHGSSQKIPSKEAESWNEEKWMRSRAISHMYLFLYSFVSVAMKMEF